MDSTLEPNTGANALACDLCILGAGVAGLNALFAASRHLSRDQKVVLVDRGAAPAGMWNEIYNYVRLHQPHPMFTAGNIPWRGQSDPSHLANRAEVVEHLNHCFEVLKERLNVDAYFGHEVIEHDESTTGDHPVSIRCRRLSDGEQVTFAARRLIKAFGYDIHAKPALTLSSDSVHSVSPDHCDLRASPLSDSDAPIYVVGGGKTGMDTAHTLIRTYPNRKVRLVAGAGTMFLSRSIAAPRGVRRHYAGSTPLEVFLDLSAHFDGRNEHAVLARLRKQYAVSVDDDCRRFMFGVLSPEENAEIRAGLDEVIKDHLVDVRDGSSGPEMHLRSGARRTIEPGAVVVNTTGYVGEAPPPYEPYISPEGRVLSIQPTSAIHFLSSQAAYFLTHLFLMDKVASTPLYEVDIPQLRDASRDAFGPAAIALTLYNTATIVDALPRWAAIDENGLDFLRFFPTHRRLWAFAKLVLFRKRHPTHLTDAMDIVRERFDVRLGRLPHLT